jgi:hypothetical protein
MSIWRYHPAAVELRETTPMRTPRHGRPPAGLPPAWDAAIMMVFRAGLVVVAGPPGRARLGQTRRYTLPSAAGRCRALDLLPTVP